MAGFGRAISQKLSNLCHGVVSGWCDESWS